MKRMWVLFVGFLLLAVSSSFCSAQHWSYGFRPGGKRDAENRKEYFEEIAKKMDQLRELQYFRCHVPCQHPALRGPRGALVNLIEEENGEKTLDLQKWNKEERNAAFSNK